MLYCVAFFIVEKSTVNLSTVEHLQLEQFTFSLSHFKVTSYYRLWLLWHV